MKTLSRRLWYVLLFLPIFINAQQKKILFVGNSYTAGNNLANITNNVAQSTGDGFIYDTHTPGGNRFLHHASNATLETKINSENWDYVTLQGQSVEVSLTGVIFDTEVAPYATELCTKIRTNNDCSQPVFFRTWGRENGYPEPGCLEYPWICTYEGMDDALAQNYQILADDNNAFVSPVGEVWRYLRTNYPSLDLYTSDGSHPSQTGSYVAALTFYTIIFRKNPTLVTYNYTLSDSNATIIKDAVKLIVFDQLALWNVGDFDPIADFSTTVNENIVDFMSTSANAETYFWDFGDGNTSTMENPTHTYLNNGDYTVSLTVEKCGATHTFTTDMSITALSIDEEKTEVFSIFPNPVDSQIYIRGIAMHNIKEVIIYSISGKEIQVVKDSDTNSIDLKKLPAGTYFLKFYTDKNTVVKKILKK